MSGPPSRMSPHQFDLRPATAGPRPSDRGDLYLQAALAGLLLSTLAWAVGATASHGDRLLPTAELNRSPSETDAIVQAGPASDDVLRSPPMASIARDAAQIADPIQRMIRIRRAVPEPRRDAPLTASWLPVRWPIRTASGTYADLAAGKPADDLSYAHLLLQLVVGSGGIARLAVATDGGLAGSRGVAGLEIWSPALSRWIFFDAVEGCFHRYEDKLLSLVELARVIPRMLPSQRLLGDTHGGTLRLYGWVSPHEARFFDGRLLLTNAARDTASHRPLWAWFSDDDESHHAGWRLRRSGRRWTLAMLLAYALCLLVTLRRRSRETPLRSLPMAALRHVGSNLASLVVPLARLLVGLAAWLRRSAIQVARIELLVIAVSGANAIAFLALSENPLEINAAGHAANSAGHLARFGFVDWLTRETCYPPFYRLWLALFSAPDVEPALLPLVLWSDILLAGGLLALGAALRGMGFGAAEVAVAVALTAGNGLFVHHTVTLLIECSVVFWTAVSIACLSSPSLPASRWAPILLGSALGGAFLSKWTSILYVGVPAILATARWISRDGRPGPTVRHLVRTGVVAALVAGPWYFGCLDWDRLRATVANDANYPGTAGWSAYLLGLDYYREKLLLAMGLPVAALVGAGVLLGLRRRPGATSFFLAGFLPPILALASFPHVEPRYLLPAIPWLGAAAAIGWSSCGRRTRIAGGCLSVLLAFAQMIHITWSGRGAIPEAPTPGPYICTDDRSVLRWTTAIARRYNERCEAMRRIMGGGEGRLPEALHPLCTHPGLNAGILPILALGNVSTGGPSSYVGYDWAFYRDFLAEVARGRTAAFLAMPSGMLEAPVENAQSIIDRAWGFVPQEGPVLEHGDAQRPADPYLLEPIRKNFGIAETLIDAEDDVYLMVRRGLWSKYGDGLPLGELPP